MTASAILTNLAARGVRVWAEADRLKFDAPLGILTNTDKELLAAHKLELLVALRPERGGVNWPFIIRANKPPTICFFDQCRDRLFREGDLLRCRRCNSYFRHLPLEPEDEAFFQILRSEASD
jgi:hypothetical protein